MTYRNKSNVRPGLLIYALANVDAQASPQVGSEPTQRMGKRAIGYDYVSR